VRVSYTRVEAAGDQAIAIQAEAADAGAVRAAIEQTVAGYGGLDLLANNAGTAIPKPFEETTLEEMDRVIHQPPRRARRHAGGAQAPCRTEAASSRSDPASANAWARRAWSPMPRRRAR
jgi:hypothetical protein